MDAFDRGRVRELAKLIVRQLHDLSVDQVQTASELAAHLLVICGRIEARLQRDDHPRGGRPTFRGAIVQRSIELWMVPRLGGRSGRCAEQADQRQRCACQEFTQHESPD